MKLAAPAKINLALHVTGQRPDGYHLIETLVAFAETGDLVTIEAATADSLSFSGPFGASLAVEGGENLVTKARDTLRLTAGLNSCPPVAIHLEKNLPLSSGIGGGSADAAATLKSLNEHWSLGLSLEDLCAIGLSLGADVPMCLHGKPLIARGIGEVIEPVDLPPFHLLLVNPGVSVSTPEIFKALTKKDNGGLPPMSGLTGKMPRNGKSSIHGGPWIEYLSSSRNDLQAPAIAAQPIISDVIAALQANGALFARMSGSGATCFGLFVNLETKDLAKVSLMAAHPEWWTA